MCIYVCLEWFVKEIPIPLPAELSIIDAKTQFEEVSDLNFLLPEH